MNPGRRYVVLALCALAVTAASCGALNAPPPLPTATPSHANLLVNGGFESGAEGWTPIPAESSGPVDVTHTVAHDGKLSLALHLRGGGVAGAGRTTGAGQPLNAQAFPEVISGFYRVDRWQSKAASQNVRFVMSVRGGDFDNGPGVHQVRFVIAGSDAAATLLPEVTQVYLSRAAPPLRRWAYFGYPVKQAFIDRFGKAPTRWEKIDVSVEAGYDGELGGEPGVSADVFFDDLYAGPLAQNPNRPADP